MGSIPAFKALREECSEKATSRAPRSCHNPVQRTTEFSKVNDKLQPRCKECPLKETIAARKRKRERNEGSTQRW